MIIVSESNAANDSLRDLGVTANAIEEYCFWNPKYFALYTQAHLFKKGDREFRGSDVEVLEKRKKNQENFFEVIFNEYAITRISLNQKNPAADTFVTVSLFIFCLEFQETIFKENPSRNLSDHTAKGQITAERGCNFNIKGCYVRR